MKEMKEMNVQNPYFKYMTEDEKYYYRKQLRMKRRARQIRIARCRIAIAAVMVILLGSVVIGGARSSAHASEAGVTKTKCYTNVEVNKGDTLWAIAGRYCDDSSNSAIQTTANEIRELNHLKFNETIHSGDKLVVPYYVYEE